MPESRFVPVAEAGGIAEKSFACIDIDDSSLVVCRFHDEYFAVENRCSHAHSSFDDGLLRGYRLMCPLHGATFDIRDGSVAGGPAACPIRSFPVRVRDGMVEVRLEAPEQSPTRRPET